MLCRKVFALNLVLLFVGCAYDSEIRHPVLNQLNATAANSSLEPMVDVALYHTGGNGTAADPWTGWETRIPLTNHTTYYFRPGHFKHNGLDDELFCMIGVSIIGEGDGTYIHGTSGAVLPIYNPGDEPAINIDQAFKNWTFIGKIQDLILDGSGGATDGLKLGGLRQFNVQNVKVVNVSDRAFGFYDCVGGMVTNCLCSYSLNTTENSFSYQSPKPRYGLYLDARVHDGSILYGGASSAITFDNLVIEGCAAPTLYTTGTVAVSGDTVTGTGTAWAGLKLPRDTRIWFGTQTPGTYEAGSLIKSTTNDTELKLEGGYANLAAGTPYVISYGGTAAYFGSCLTINWRNGGCGANNGGGIHVSAGALHGIHFDNIENTLNPYFDWLLDGPADCDNCSGITYNYVGGSKVTLEGSKFYNVHGPMYRLITLNTDIRSTLGGDPNAYGTHLIAGYRYESNNARHFQTTNDAAGGYLPERIGSGGNTHHWLSPDGNGVVTPSLLYREQTINVYNANIHVAKPAQSSGVLCETHNVRFRIVRLGTGTVTWDSIWNGVGNLQLSASSGAIDTLDFEFYSGSEKFELCGKFIRDAN